MVIQLRFVPEVQRTDNATTFQTTFQENRCVKCGSVTHLVKHHILPICYVRHLKVLHFPSPQHWPQSNAHLQCPLVSGGKKAILIGAQFLP